MEGPSQDRTAGYTLLHTGSLVDVEITKTDIHPTVDGNDDIVSLELQLGHSEDEFPPEDHEWGGLGFIFCLATLSFADARPAGESGMDFEVDDEFTVADLHDHLRYVKGEIRFSADYVRGRLIKTDIDLRPDGSVRLATRLRGVGPTRWIRTLRKQKLLAVVEADGEPA